MYDRNKMALAGLALSLGMIVAASPSYAATRAIKAPSHAAPRAIKAKAPAVARPASENVTQMANWVIASGDNRGLPFAVIDKVAAEVVVYNAKGRLRGAGPALLGLTPGDDSTPGIGDREMSAIAPEERTTPAGRFLVGFGPGPAGGPRKVLWVDYATAISMHPVVTAHPKERRPQRLRSPTPDDNRITYGCINVSAAFYANVVRRTFARAGGVVYILPEVRRLDEAFPTYRAQAQPSPAPTDEPGKGLSLAKSQGASDAVGSAGSDVTSVR